MYDEYNIYGPYQRSDGREHVVLYNGEHRKTISYPRFLIETKLGRKLKEDEIVHHKDGDKSNNNLSNLKIIERSKHSSKHAVELKAQSFICPMCGESFLLEGKKLYDAKYNRKEGSAGPFCSIECAGRYSALVAHGKIDELEVKEIKTEYKGEYAN